MCNVVQSFGTIGSIIIAHSVLGSGVIQVGIEIILGDVLND